MYRKVSNITLTNNLIAARSEGRSNISQLLMSAKHLYRYLHWLAHDTLSLGKAKKSR